MGRWHCVRLVVFCFGSYLWAAWAFGGDVNGAMARSSVSSVPPSHAAGSVAAAAAAGTAGEIDIAGTNFPLLSPTTSKLHVAPILPAGPYARSCEACDVLYLDEVGAGSTSDGVQILRCARCKDGTSNHGLHSEIELRKCDPHSEWIVNRNGRLLCARRSSGPVEVASLRAINHNHDPTAAAQAAVNAAFVDHPSINLDAELSVSRPTKNALGQLDPKLENERHQEQLARRAAASPRQHDRLSSDGDVLISQSAAIGENSTLRDPNEAALRLELQHLHIKQLLKRSVIEGVPHEATSAIMKAAAMAVQDDTAATPKAALIDLIVQRRHDVRP